ncbi:hypothetical protein HCA78_15515 [Listeria booriae]|uniref:Uncharacterized protein n=1 Tax=Listeria booriae TaxID=1552123 RepID=A0A841ZJ59_9LIST|nr:hypothetical protein [Listeria booriae]MBC1513677.1 hypothetical protein [Listeria booriae]MBC2005183.1 hypothetical protein [Listeria booriae]MBC2164426.1 hypothetical protein [Listeria booriae]MBC2324247.1 hypothetical protein [Listeria booriae]MBC6152613.1 hypothetical protein [Listeria booriae]
MKKVFLSSMAFILVLTMGFSVNSTPANAQLQNMGAVSHSMTSKSNTWYERKFHSYLTSSWAKASKYKVSKSVTATSSVNVSISPAGIKWLKANFSYNNTRTTKTSVGTTVPADSKRNSKLAFDVRYKKHTYDETTKYKFYETNTNKYSYQTKVIKNSTATVPVDSYIYVKYQ